MHNFIQRLTFTIIAVVLSLSSAQAAQYNAHGQRIEPTIFGEIIIKDKVIADLIESPVMQRLHHIDQSGTPHYFTQHIPSFTRYDHSIGVYALLHKVGAPLNEQIAGLLHDASHSVFSHTGDWVVGNGAPIESSQDDRHNWYLNQMKVDETIHPYNISLQQILHKGNGYNALEQDLPDMCADRIEYNLHTALIFGLLSKEEVKKIANDVRFENGKWFFTDVKLAKKFAQLSIYFTQYFWGSPFNQTINHWSGQMMKRAFEVGAVHQDEFHFGTDQEVVAKLKASDDPVIKDLLNKCQNFQDHYEVVDSGPHDMDTKPKFRGIDPLVKVKGKLVRLTSIDDDYNREYNRVKSFVKTGIKIRLF
jgi:uncharacterized protein